MDGLLREAVEAHGDRIAQETLTEDLGLAEDLGDGAVAFEVGGSAGKLTVRVIS